jgi:hypothetical protein
VSQHWPKLCEEFARESALRELAGARGLTVDGETLQAAVDAFRKTRGLLKREDMTTWLESAGLTLDDVERHVSSALLREALEASLADEELLDYANAQNGALDCLRFSLIESASAQAAQANLDRIAGGVDFEEVARSTSTDGSSGPQGGQLEWFSRRDLPETFAAPLFDSEPGSVLGPLSHSARWYLIRCDEGPVPPPLHRLELIRPEVAAHLVEQAL